MRARLAGLRTCSVAPQRGQCASAPAPGARLPEVPRQGSWFAPVEDEDVVRLLREASLSATRLRGVCLPSAAPDRVVNLGEGTVKDAAMLMKSVIERVHQAQGIKLQDAMRWAGRHT